MMIALPVQAADFNYDLTNYLTPASNETAKISKIALKITHLLANYPHTSATRNKMTRKSNLLNYLSDKEEQAKVEKLFNNLVKDEYHYETITSPIIIADGGQYYVSLTLNGSTKLTLSMIIKDDKLVSLTSSYGVKNKVNTVEEPLVKLTTIRDKSIVAEANGVFINENIILTTYNYLYQSLLKGYFMAGKCGQKNFNINEVIAYSELEDYALLKVDYQATKYISKLASNSDLLADRLSKNSDQTLMEGTPIINDQNELIGIINNQINHTGYYLINRYQATLFDYDVTKSSLINSLKEALVFNPQKIKEQKLIDNSITFDAVGDYPTTIDLSLIKRQNYDQVVSLRYKNMTNVNLKPINTLSGFRSALENSGYKIKYESSSKFIYRNNNYQIIVNEFLDYLLILIEKRN